MIWQKLSNSELIKNTSILVSGTVLAQLIPILLQPLLRRFYSPESFGAYSVYLSLLGILAVIASLKYELAIVLPKKDKDSINILFLSFIINLFFNVFLLVFIILWKKSIITFLNISAEFSFYIYLVPLGVFFINLYQSINLWLIRKSRFLAISKNKFIRRSLEGSSQLLLSYFKSPHGLIFGDLVGHFTNVLYGFWQSIKFGLDVRKISLIKVRYVVQKYSEFPRFNVVPSFMSACSYLLPAIFINKFYSSTETGFFDLSKLVLSIPLALIAISISNVLLQKLTERFQKGQSIIDEIYPIIFIVLFISVSEIILILLFGERLFVLIFGKEWILSGTISVLLVWAYAFNFFIASFSSIYIAMKKIKLLSIWQIFYFLSILSLGLFSNFTYLKFLKIFNFIQIIACIVSFSFMTYILFTYESKLENMDKEIPEGLNLKQ